MAGRTMKALALVNPVNRRHGLTPSSRCGVNATVGWQRDMERKN